MTVETVSNNLFEVSCETIAHSYVQTMVFMDDRAGYDSPKAPEQKTVSPPKGIGGRASKKIIPQKTQEELDTGEDTHSLNVADILESAMKSGLICSVHKPQSEDDYKLENLQAVLNADIVCLDWILKDGDDGVNTSRLVKGIIQEDLKVGGKHRLIAIYTYKPDLKGILKSIEVELKPLTECILDTENMTLTGTHFRILGLRKFGGTQLKNLQVTEKDLPDRLVKEFSTFNSGLIPNLTMASIAVLREETAHILAKLNSNLDGPFLTHKSLLPTPDDATNYASEIVSSELKTIIHKHRIADKLLSDDIIKSFVDTQVTTVLKYLDNKGNQIETDIDADTLFKLIVEGVRNVEEELIDSIKLQIPKESDDEDPARSIISKSLCSFLTEDHASALANNRQFLRITSIATDQTSKIYLDKSKGGYGKNPSLSLGSIIKKRKKYLLCLQPSCDSVRIPNSGRPFWFIELIKNKSKPMLVVSHEGDLVGLEYSAKVKNSKLIEFDRTDDIAGTVIAERNGKKLMFKSKEDGENQYQWISDLKPNIARKIGQELANQYSRIGLDEFELSRMGWEYK